MEKTTRNKIVFFTGFTFLGILALQVPLMKLVGSSVSFTLFDAFAPIAGAFLGSIPGIIAVLLMQGFHFVTQGMNFSDPATLIRLLPLAMAALYFSRKMPLNVIVPALAIIAFVAHPVGREVWYFSLFWTIPIICYFFQERWLLARALGATFMAHSVGGALWVWFVPIPAAVWVGLIPVVIMERLLFAAGIASTYLVVNNAFAFLNEKLKFGFRFPVQEKHVATFLREKPAQ
ncbi:MAG: hypothetical protein UY42_C0020G0002 [Parcubacteria group bacterium GW2011_GWA2_49_16]|nr:MAG: hypothetical protein UY42_C0020G0002 [Parcubacteria group bacterium GW2011_GWA2_49_16]